MGTDNDSPGGSSPVPAEAQAKALPLQPPHAFHRHLPPHHHQQQAATTAADATAVPYITRIAHHKARKIVDLAHSIQLNEALFLEGGDVGGTARQPTHHRQAQPQQPDYDDGVDEENEDMDVEDLDVEDGDDYLDVDDEVEDREGGADGSRRYLEPSQVTPSSHGPPETLQSLTKKLSRLQAQLTGLEALKYSGITQLELCQIVLHLLKLVTCTIEHRNPAEGGVKLQFENVGYLWQGREEPASEPEPGLEDGAAQLERQFALHSPAREMLLLILINILSNKGPLRSVSNAAIYPETEEGNGVAAGSSPPRSLLILHWKALLRTLLRTAPYLDEKKTAHVKSDSNYRQTTVLKRTVQLIRDARHFFDQGVRPPPWPTSAGSSSEEATPAAAAPPPLDHAARQVWDLVKTDILYHSHTHACYRGTILLYLFHPSRCTPQYYLDVMPLWWSSWTNIDRCPEYDFLYLACFCRARKHIAPHQYDWGPIRRRLLTHAQYWLQLPIGGAAMDKSFPRAPNPRSRSCPPRLKVFTGAASSYEEGIDFVAKVVKLLVTGLGTGPPVPSTGGDTAPLSEGTHDLLRFLSFATPYFNPSNIGSWTFTLGAFLHYFAYELSCRVGAAAGARTLQQSHPAAARALADAQPGAALAIPPAEVVALLDALLPLCQQAIYSKNPHVGRAGEAALLYLVQIDSARATPSFVDFAVRALDVQAVNLSHQAPSALSALTRLVQPALRCDPSVLLLRLPDLLSLSLAGIDSNDQNKTIRTLILYRSLTSWLPVGGKPETWPCLAITEAEVATRGHDGTVRLGTNLMQDLVAMRDSYEYREAIARLPETSLLKLGSRDDTHDPDLQRLALDEASSALSDWAVEFLERVFGLLRASGEREKAAKTASGVATRHSSADVHQARNFSRVLIECLMQLFASMESEVHAQSVQSLVRFLEVETHPSAAKDASLVCQAASAARTATSSPGLDALIPVLTNELHRHSTKCAVYRLRCFAGAVRWAGKSVISHRAAISKAIDFALASDDRHLFKTGCKLLRHTLSTLTESYPLSTDSSPRLFRDPSGSLVLGRSGQLSGDPITWHVPDGDCIGFAAELLETHVSRRLWSLCSESSDGKQSRLLHSTDVADLRRCLRVIRYSIRGAATILLDDGLDPSNDDVVAYEIASYKLLEAAGQEVRNAVLQLRGRLSTFLIVLNSIIASDTLYPEGLSSLPDNEPTQKALSLISADPKVCKETCDLALLLLTRRGAMFRSQEARTIWKAQKQVSADFTLCSQVDRMAEALQSADLYGSSAALLYKDGEDAGKTLPRRLVVARVQLFHTSLQRNASFEVPRRMRRLEREEHQSREILFFVKSSLPETIEYLERLLRGKNHRPLDAYEGIIDGLFALCCHSNTQVRASAISVVDYAMTRFGWIVAPRVPRMLSALSLQDARMNGKFGVPSCALLVDQLNHQGKRKRLAEAVKGVCSILSLTRAVRQMLGSWKMRHRFVETLCGTDRLVSLLPAEEMQKIIQYLQTVFSPFRSSFYMKPRTSASEIEYHGRSIGFVLDILSERKSDSSTGSGDMSDADLADGRSAHWRKLLIASWFLLVFVDEGDVRGPSTSSSQRIWDTCFYVLENNFGQPLQRVALGLFGKLICLLDDSSDSSLLQSKMASESFCRVLGKALVYDHKEDTSVGGGHDAQWSSGVETIIRDASRHVAPRTLFPFQRTSQSLGSFKVPHSQFLELLLTILDESTALAASHHLLALAKELMASPPSEDQRNQQITAAEIYAGICGSFIRSSRLSQELWSSLLLPFLEDALAKTPFSLCGAYFDAIRYALQFALPESYFPLTVWLTEKVKSTLWQPNESAQDDAADKNGASQGTEGFTAQSKWLYLFSAVLIEMDETESDDVYTKPARFVQNLLAGGNQDMDCSECDVGVLETSWKLVTELLLPRLTDALGHPFDSCRDHISRCLFRICYSHRKMARVSASKAPSRSSSFFELAEAVKDTKDPGWIIVDRLASLSNDSSLTYKNKFNSLITARRFISNCVHLGEAKFEFSDYVIPLMSLAFESLDVTSEDDASSNSADTTAVAASSSNNDDTSAARRALEAEVVKGFRGMISEVSVTAVISYGSDLDIARVLDAVEGACRHEKWQVRHAGINYLRCFQGAHKFLFRPEHAEKATSIVIDLLADDRREVSSAAMAALTGVLAATPADEVAQMVHKYAKLADASKMRRPRKGASSSSSAAAAAAGASPPPSAADAADLAKEKKRLRNQQVSVFFLCATIMACPYDTPPYVPQALASISKHSFERSAPLSVRDTVKRCCAEYKRTHMSDNWEEHRRNFSQEQLEALEDVVSTPHYYA